MKKTISVTVSVMLVILFLLPFTLMKLSEPIDFMGLMMLFFFIVNPIAAVCIHITLGKAIKKLWWLPFLFSLLFLLSYWVILQQIVWDLAIYAGTYLVLGALSMLVSRLITGWAEKRNT